jgi:hypothetical protein
MLCELRIALHPMSFNIFICLRNAALFTATQADPNRDEQTPLNLVTFPLRLSLIGLFNSHEFQIGRTSSFSSLPTYNLETALYK